MTQEEDVAAYRKRLTEKWYSLPTHVAFTEKEAEIYIDEYVKKYERLMYGDETITPVEFDGLLAILERK